MAAAATSESDAYNRSTPAALIIKTPNQKVKDIKLNCLLGWSVKELKVHLSSIYPTQPLPQAQKLIYSGKLLEDNDLLLQCLRQFKADEDQIIHMVCSISSNSLNENQQSTKAPDQSSIRNPQSSMNSDESRELPVSTEEPNNTTESNVSQPAFLFANTANTISWQTSMVSIHQNSNTIPSAVAYAAAAAANSAYWSYYYWYLHNYNNFQRNQLGNTRLNTNQTYTNNNGQDGHVNDMDQRAAPANNNINNNNNNNNNRVANENAAMNVAAGVMDDEEQNLIPNDWLDYIYGFFRIGLVLLVLWFHSSPVLFGIMLVVVSIIYLYQNGFLAIRRRVVARNADENPDNARNANNEPLANDRNENVPIAERVNENSEQNQPQETQQVDSPSLFFVVRSFVFSFFTSLIPRNPEAV